MVGICKYTDRQIQFIVVAKKHGCTNKEIAMAFQKNWPFAKEVTTGSVKYVVSKYQDDPQYNVGQLPAGQVYQDNSSTQMLMRPHPTQAMGQMVMYPQQSHTMSQMAMRSQQLQTFTPHMAQPQQLYGQASPMMGGQQSFGGPQRMVQPRQSHGQASPVMGAQQSFRRPMNRLQQPLNAAPGIMSAQQPRSNQQSTMPAQPAAGATMSHAEILGFAHATMSPVQFLAFAQALSMPAGTVPAISPRPAPVPATPTQPQVFGSASPPALATQSGIRTEAKSKSTAPESPKQTHMASTPTVRNAQVAVNTSVLMTPQNSRGPTDSATSPQQSQMHSQDMSFLQQIHQTSLQPVQLFNQSPVQSFYGVAQDVAVPQQPAMFNQPMPGLEQQFLAPTTRTTSNGQAQVLTGFSASSQNALTAAVNQTQMIGQGIQQPMIGSAGEATNTATAMPKKATPYLGIVPPAKRPSQSNQLGMLNKFGPRKPLSPVASTKTRVTKNAPFKPLVLSQAQNASMGATVQQAKNDATESAIISPLAIAAAIKVPVDQTENAATELVIHRQTETATIDTAVHQADNAPIETFAHPQLPTSSVSKADKTFNNHMDFIMIDDDEDDEELSQEAETELILGIKKPSPCTGHLPFSWEPADSAFTDLELEEEDSDDDLLNDIARYEAEKSRQSILDRSIPQGFDHSTSSESKAGTVCPMDLVLSARIAQYNEEMAARGLTAYNNASDDTSDAMESGDDESVNDELADDDPNKRVATPDEINNMTSLQEYCYGIRQGLPNKGYLPWSSQTA